MSTCSRQSFGQYRSIERLLTRSSISELVKRRSIFAKDTLERLFLGSGQTLLKTSKHYPKAGALRRCSETDVVSLGYTHE